jgi:hypothetical protein
MDADERSGFTSHSRRQGDATVIYPYADRAFADLGLEG